MENGGFKSNQTIALVEKALKISDHIEFNVLYVNPGEELDIFLRRYDGKIINEKNGRFYNTHKRIRVPIGEPIRNLLVTLSFSNWKNEVVEDPAFIDKYDREVLACITHEDMIAIKEEYECWLSTI